MNSENREGFTPPVDLDALSQFDEIEQNIRNLISIEQLQDAIKDGDEKGLVLDLSGVQTLADGQSIDPNQIYGIVAVGPFPFESEETDYNYRRFRVNNPVTGGRGTIGTTKLLPPELVGSTSEPENSEDWVDRGTVAVRVNLYLEQPGQDLLLGTYDTYTAFRLEDTNNNGSLGDEGDETLKLASFVEVPSVYLINSDDPTQMVIAFETAEAEVASVTVEGVGTFSSAPATNHEVVITGLSPDTEYSYTVTIGEGDRQVDFFPDSNFTTAPVVGQLPEDGFSFMFISDSRDESFAGQPPIYDGGLVEQQLMGVNADTLERAVNLGWQKGADLLVFGGDLILGYTTSVEDYSMQFEAFKQVTAGFGASNPVYTGVGNHEVLARAYDNGVQIRPELKGILVDRFDENGSYDTESSEAIFAAEFVNPTNGPEPEVATRPSYDENVYSFQHGTVKFIAFNNNYWSTWPSEAYAAQVGGSPEGYIFQDQLQWIESELAAAEADDTVDHVVLFGQEPVFPNGGHRQDAMWYDGDNNIRAWTYDGTALIPEEKGILEVRDQFIQMVSESSKVAAVLSGDEHSYHRTLIDNQVPIGDITQDDTDGDGVIEPADGESYSPLSSLENPVWYLSIGGAGAAYFSEGDTPWNEYWNAQAAPLDGFKYSSQEHTSVFEVTEDGLALEIYSIYGELIDRVDNLMAVKGSGTLDDGLRIEAEDLELVNYQVEKNDIASGGEVISFRGASEDTGTASTTFDGLSGVYDIVVGHFDEKDGIAQVQLQVNDDVVGSVLLDKELGSGLPNEMTFTEATISEVELNPGDTLTIQGTRDANEFARIDFLQLSPSMGAGNGNDLTSVDSPNFIEMGVEPI